MKKIGLTQRVEVHSGIKETRDCLDQRWHPLLTQYNLFGIAIPTLSFKSPQYLKMMNFSGFLLTGGNDISNLHGNVNSSYERDELERQILNYSMDLNLPILGVCRGFQFLNIYLGGSLSKANGHIARRHKVNVLKNSMGFKQSKLEVNSYHGWCIHENDLADDLIPLAVADDGSVEAAYHRTMNWFGIMWHPERSFCEIDNSIFDFIFSETDYD